MTFLFTDIEGSTHRWESDPDAMRIALADHDSVLQSAIEAHEGRIFKHTGDGVCAAFMSARQRVDAAIEASCGWRCQCGWALQRVRSRRKGPTTSI